jgi:hypothetical protein
VGGRAEHEEGDLCSGGNQPVGVDVVLLVPGGIVPGSTHGDGLHRAPAGSVMASASPSHTT